MLCLVLLNLTYQYVVLIRRLLRNQKKVCAGALGSALKRE